MKTLISLILIVQIALPAAWATERKSRAVRQADGRESLSALKLLRTELEQHAEQYVEEPSRNSKVDEAVQNQVATHEQIDAIKKELLDTSIPLSEIKERLHQRILDEEEIQRVDIKSALEKMSTDRLDSLFDESMKLGRYPVDLKMDYISARLDREKREILLQLMMNDLSQIKSVTLKRIGLLEREDLVKELENTQNLLNVKGKRTWKIVLTVVLTVAISGLVSWAIISATKNSWERKTRELESDFQKKNANLETEYQKKMADLEREYIDKGQSQEAEYLQKQAALRAIFEERARLRDQGFIWTTCSTQTQNTSASCSFDGLVHSGAQVCVTNCLKNPSTGVEMQHSTSCSSAFIPVNCFMPNPYSSGYNSGYSSGNDDGYRTGYDRAYNEAYNKYYDINYDPAYTGGYDRGYNDGYNSGLSQREYDDSQYDDDDYDSDDDDWDDDSGGGWDDGDDWGGGGDSGGDSGDDSGGWDDWDSDDTGYDDWMAKRSGVAGIAKPKAKTDTVLSGYKKGYKEGYATAVTSLTTKR